MIKLLNVYSFRDPRPSISRQLNVFIENLFAISDELFDATSKFIVYGVA